jgi:hypothetical protein
MNILQEKKETISGVHSFLKIILRPIPYDELLFPTGMAVLLSGIAQFGYYFIEEIFQKVFLFSFEMIWHDFYILLITQ